ncbi:MAG: EsaB/YukD family protein [Lachnospiraceae bacterium]
MILVDVYIPAIDENYDFMLDENAAIEQVTAEISGMIAKKMGETGTENQGFTLCSLDDKKRLKGNKTLHTSGITDGSRLLLL